MRAKLPRIGEALALTAEHALLAQSGGATLERLREFTDTSVDRGLDRRLTKDLLAVKHSTYIKYRQGM